ncbi:SH3 domain-containing protein [Paradevosia shaoguanensis]|uniref:SH3 domain-containing protein n=1 Tax=Paradevosia shaoguanensis TaxID=1335043 RepID=A0AA41UC62_9HYPH|nr:SH3 domain-containing protein [Paradevosia shaoguanensis]MCF1743537.1 SH3 domain-containing protein [Paradevosia shaoguanensis]MCI0128020.1 SH3 domain-containing protein [Paradevosia shaoguanensis]
MSALRKKILAGGLAALAFAVTAGAAMAAPAFATSNVNVRSGPGTGYRAVDVLQRGDRVDVQQCRGSWCFISKPGPDGWVSANYLSSGGGDYYRPRPPRPPVYPIYPRPPVYPDWGWNDGWRPGPGPGPGWGHRPPPRPRPGASFCMNGPNGYFCMGN